MILNIFLNTSTIFSSSKLQPKEPLLSDTCTKDIQAKKAILFFRELIEGLSIS